MKGNKMLSQSVADNILSMITIEKRFSVGDKLPNELDLSEELNVSRTTLREAIRILVTLDILEIQRGKGTYVKENAFKKGKSIKECEKHLSRNNMEYFPITIQEQIRILKECGFRSIEIFGVSICVLVF